MHPIPNHLETEDQFVFGLTIRQCLLLFVGAGLSDALFTNTFALFPQPTTVDLIMCLAMASLCFMGVVTLAFVKRGGRGLEEWGLILLVYLAHSRVYTWHFHTPDQWECREDLCQQQRASHNEEKQEDQAW
ncbi:MAG: PrgI family protein [Ktedonobacteraceae bacterium]|nr:PrgI family protein [Ktedonobacteraceae bacterium]